MALLCLYIVPDSKRLVIFRRDVLHDFTDSTVKDSAKVVYGGSVQRFVFPQLVDGGAGDVVVFDQGVGGFIRSF